jgi:ferredoxin--NADP+ reductase
MFRIIAKDVLSQGAGTRIIRIRVSAPAVALKAQAGEFVLVMVTGKGERIPLTIADRDVQEGSITLVFQEAGFSTRLLGQLAEGETLYALTGPLGQATHVPANGKIVLVGGGVGIAELYPVARAFREKNNRVMAVLGARTKDLLVLVDDMRRVAHDFHIVTDDGSCGRQGVVTDVLREILLSDPSFPVYTVGPLPMMKAVAQVARQAGAPAVVSLNSLMVDGTGMCGGCRVTVGGQIRFVCVDGPEFDAHQIDWEELAKRNKVYKEKEAHICRLDSL